MPPVSFPRQRGSRLLCWVVSSGLAAWVPGTPKGFPRINRAGSSLREGYYFSPKWGWFGLYLGQSTLPKEGI